MYSREVDEFNYTFGVSGKLLRNTLLMFDYETESLWPVITGESITGVMKGKKLKEIVSSQKIAWKEWKLLYPDTKVLSLHKKETPGYDNYMDYHTSLVKTGIFPVENRDHRLDPKTTVISININGKQKVYPLDIFRKRKYISDKFQDSHLLIYHDSRTNNTVVYNRSIENTILDFNNHSLNNKKDKSVFKDSLTETEWDLDKGVAIKGKLKGTELKKIDFKNIYWFIWAEYFPLSEIYKE